MDGTKKGVSMTISEAMVLLRTIQRRINELTILRNQNSVEKRTWYMRDTGEDKQRDETTVKYDVKALDVKISWLSGEVFKLDTAIKRANAKTEIGVEVDVDKILEPIV